MGDGKEMNVFGMLALGTGFCPILQLVISILLYVYLLLREIQSGDVRTAIHWWWLHNGLGETLRIECGRR